MPKKNSSCEFKSKLCQKVCHITVNSQLHSLMSYSSNQSRFVSTSTFKAPDECIESDTVKPYDGHHVDDSDEENPNLLFQGFKRPQIFKGAENESTPYEVVSYTVYALLFSNASLLTNPQCNHSLHTCALCTTAPKSAYYDLKYLLDCQLHQGRDQSSLFTDTLFISHNTTLMQGHKEGCLKDLSHLRWPPIYLSQ